MSFHKSSLDNLAELKRHYEMLGDLLRDPALNNENSAITKIRASILDQIRLRIPEIHQEIHSKKT